MPKDQRTFTKEFKVEVVHLVQTSGKSQAQIAREPFHCRQYPTPLVQRIRYSRGKAFVGSGNLAAGEEELRRLKQELEVTRQERDILKKSIRHFFEKSTLIYYFIAEQASTYPASGGIPVCSSLGKRTVGIRV